MSLLHGDHTAKSTGPLWLTVATTGSHEIGNPCTTLAKGRAYDLYSSRTITFGGIDMWSGCVDDLEECDYKAKVVVDEVESWLRLYPI